MPTAPACSRNVNLTVPRNLIHWQSYKRAVDVAWTAGPATTIEQSYPLGGPSPCR